MSEATVAYYVEGPDEWTTDKSLFESACEAGLIADEYTAEDLIKIIVRQAEEKVKLKEDIKSELDEFMTMSIDGIHGENKNLYLSMIHRKAESLRNKMVMS